MAKHEKHGTGVDSGSTGKGKDEMKTVAKVAGGPVDSAPGKKSDKK